MNNAKNHTCEECQSYRLTIDPQARKRAAEHGVEIIPDERAGGTCRHGPPPCNELGVVTWPHLKPSDEACVQFHPEESIDLGQLLSYRQVRALRKALQDLEVKPGSVLESAVKIIDTEVHGLAFKRRLQDQDDPIVSVVDVHELHEGGFLARFRDNDKYGPGCADDLCEAIHLLSVQVEYRTHPERWHTQKDEERKWDERAEKAEEKIEKAGLEDDGDLSWYQREFGSMHRENLTFREDGEIGRRLGQCVCDYKDTRESEEKTGGETE